MFLCPNARNRYQTPIDKARQFPLHAARRAPREFDQFRGDETALGLAEQVSEHFLLNL
jgi:hypothetical protein